MFLNLKATKFTLEELNKAAKKRYSQLFHEDDLKNALEDAQEKKQTLEQAAADLVKLYVETDGHERNVILSVEEIEERRTKANKEGIVKAIVEAMRKGATEAELKTTVRYQITLRKLALDPFTLGSTIVESLVENKYAVIKENRNSLSWHLASRSGKYAIDKLSANDFSSLCPDFENFKVYDRGYRPKREVQEEY